MAVWRHKINPLRLIENKMSQWSIHMDVERRSMTIEPKTPLLLKKMESIHDSSDPVLSLPLKPNVPPRKNRQSKCNIRNTAIILVCIVIAAVICSVLSTIYKPSEDGSSRQPQPQPPAIVIEASNGTEILSPTSTASPGESTNSIQNTFRCGKSWRDANTRYLSILMMSFYKITQ